MATSTSAPVVIDPALKEHYQKLLGARGKIAESLKKVGENRAKAKSDFLNAQLNTNFEGPSALAAFTAWQTQDKGFEDQAKALGSIDAMVRESIKPESPAPPLTAAQAAALAAVLQDEIARLNSRMKEKTDESDSFRTQRDEYQVQLDDLSRTPPAPVPAKMAR